MTPLRLLALGSAAIAWHGAALPGAWAQTPRAETAANSNDFFESKIRPILATRCYSCHSASSKMRFANLLLDSREAMLRGGDHGPVVEPGSPEASRLLQAVKYQGLRMPPAAKLPDAEIADLERWIRIGAPWPAERSTATASAKAGGARKPHWSWQPLRRDFPPGSSIDAFARTALARSGIAANPEANRRALIRRVSYDVTGLPPSASAIDAFEADADPRAYERLVDGLLASPRFGERWGRHWLDLARFSDAGFNNVRFPYAFTYRDWVIGAFNADMPYDRFVVRQLAADQLEEGSAHLPALGFLSLGFNTPRLTNQPDNVDDRIDTVTRTFLGLTVSCARCHDHKYDPIPTRDYYSLYGVFANTHSPADPAPAAPPGPASPLDRYYLPRLATRLAAIDGYKRERLAEIAAEARQPETVAKYLRTAWEARGMTNPQVENLSKERNLNLRILQRWRAWTAGDRTLSGAQQLDDATLDAIVRRLADSGFLETPAAPPSLPLEDFIHVLTEGDFNTTNNLRWKRDRVFADYAYRGALLGAPPRAMQVADNARIVPAHVFIRGNPNDPGAEVPPQFLSVIGGKQPARFTHGAGRLDLARAIVDPSNPLTARVWVNRVWMHLFGEGLTRSASDFGTRGDEPSHPAMLDFLADSLMRDDWSTKKLIRRIVLSDAYRRSSSDNAAARAIDPDNRLLWRHNRRRLDFEALRDSMLVAAGRLDERIGGPSFSLESLPADPRRTMYAFVERERAQALLKAFDYADPERHTEQRDNTTVPQQSLFLMNSEFVAEQARRLSERSPGIGEMFRHALGRLPSEAERAAFAVSEPCASAPGAAPPWRYGYGEFDAAAGRVAAFTPFEFFVEDTWQAASLLPHPDSGVASLTATGGAPGPDARHAVIRRWVAPSGGTVDIAGSLSHPVDQFVRRFGLTDGIRARIVHSRLGVLGEWTFGPPEPVTAGESSEAAKKARKVETAVAGVEVRAGDTIDFAVDAIEDAEEDRFTWSPSITAVGGDSKWKAAADFAGPPLEPRCPRSQLAQVLLMSNEFAFVD